MPISDLVAGLYGAFGVACALVARRGRTRARPARRVEHDQRADQPDGVPERQLPRHRPAPARTGNEHPIAAPYGLFRAADGEVAIAPSTDEVVRRLFRALGIEPMLDRPEFSGYAQRLRTATP